MRLDVDAAVIELGAQLKTPADSPWDKVKDSGLRRPLTTERTVAYFITEQLSTQEAAILRAMI